MLPSFRAGCRIAGLLAGFSLLFVGALPAGGASPKLSPYHQPPLLITPGRQVTLAYAILPFRVKCAVYVRNDRQERFTRLSLARRRYCPGDRADAAAMQRDKVCGDAFVARIPGRLVAGSRLYYYAVLRDGGRRTILPSGGAAQPQRVWVVHRAVKVSLGRHRFGQLKAPDAIVAVAGPQSWV
jgi:hypothetical protein